ncbi:torsin-1A-interacting protein 2 isoform X2 [Entelurus aequoreus]|uniref:torsin-1A-interacting protein 2 isoform X2 n=1 Tax=Entelurus aequoreus TaxID=161455 RepID=UPI002B1E7FBC|nr:torsin-1A-interacting protein 2 isoform X2 [Entelurus aequoreus]
MEDPDRTGDHGHDTGAVEEEDQSTNESPCEGLNNVTITGQHPCGGKNGGQAEERSVHNVEKSCTSPDPDRGTDDGEDGRGEQRNEEPAVKATEFAPEEEQPRDEEAPEDTTAVTGGDTNHDQVDGPTAGLPEDTNDDGKDLAQSLNTGSSCEDKEPYDDLRSKVETIGPTTQETDFVTEVTANPGRISYLIAFVMMVLLAILAQHLLQPEPPPPSSVSPIDIFLREMDKVMTRFPHQRPELWRRSRIHLKRHILTAQPSEPVSLVLTAGVSGRKTLRCLASNLASAVSTAINATVLHIDGANVGEDSYKVKEDIDLQLQQAFEGDKPVAVIHRFEQLPPGSTLIFYRYCDHENAAYKKTFLIFTVLLEDEIPVEASLRNVEEMVDDHLQRKFLSHDRFVAFDRMDLDKYGGLWSRISHLILPVAAEERTEQEGCFLPGDSS